MKQLEIDEKTGESREITFRRPFVVGDNEPVRETVRMCCQGHAWLVDRIVEGRFLDLSDLAKHIAEDTPAEGDL